MSSKLAQVEAVVNEYARTKAKEWATGIKPSQFQVLLVKGKNWDMRVQRGNPVSILLPWPEGQLKINTLLRDAFSLIREKRLVDCIELSTVMYTHSRGNSKKKWYREHYGVETELLAELIPKKEIRVETTHEIVTTVVVRDMITGVELSTVNTHKESKITDGRALEMKQWLELSRMANEVVEEIEITGTPMIEAPEFPKAPEEARTEESFVKEFGPQPAEAVDGQPTE